LNATVKAARAGEDGHALPWWHRKYAVSRSSSAAKEIKELIEDAVQRVGFGDEQVSRAGTTMEVVVRSVKLVSAIMAGYSHVAGMLLACCWHVAGMLLACCWHVARNAAAVAIMSFRRS
jgi:hypothetical protein